MYHLVRPARRRGYHERLGTLWLASLLLAGGLSLAKWRLAPTAPVTLGAPAFATLEPAVTGKGVGAEALEAVYGLRVTQIAVTAGGGPIVVRLEVADTAKAARAFAAGSTPVLVDEKSDATVRPGAAPGPEGLADDQVLSFLFPNALGAVRPGDTVSVVFGDVRLEQQVSQ